MQRSYSFVLCLLLVGLLLAPVAYGQEAKVTRNIADANYDTGDTIPVSLTAAKIDVEIAVEEILKL